MTAAEAAVERAREALKAQGREREFYKLVNATPFGLAKRYRVLYHHGLVWLWDEKTFGTVEVNGLPYGAVPDGVEPDLQPSVLIQEHRGIVSVMLVPVNPKAETGDVYASRREASNADAWDFCVKQTDALFSKKKKDKPAPPVALGPLSPVIIGQFPVSSVAALEHSAEEVGPFSHDRWLKAYERLRELCGLKEEERLPEDVWNTGWENEYVNFTFRGD
jgi:hypothetical protein